MSSFSDSIKRIRLFLSGGRYVYKTRDESGNQRYVEVVLCGNEIVETDTPYKPEPIPKVDPSPKEFVPSLYDYLVNGLQCYTKDELQNFPFDLDYLATSPGEYDGSDWYHYGFSMDLTGRNIDIAKWEIENIRRVISTGSRPSIRVPAYVGFRTADIQFSEYNPGYGYSGLSCKPYESKTKISRAPFYLHFMTRIDRDDPVLGNIRYYADGRFHSADVVIWKNKVGYKYKIRCKKEVPYIFTIEKSGNGELISWNIVYEDPIILKQRAFEQREHARYEWLKINLPDICPKSYSGYRRMKKQNTKNFQKLSAKAIELGKDITEDFTMDM